MKRGNLSKNKKLRIILPVIVVVGLLGASAFYLKQSSDRRTATQQNSQTTHQNQTSDSINQDVNSPAKPGDTIQATTTKMFTHPGGTYTMGTLYDMTIKYPSDWKASSEFITSPDFTPTDCHLPEEDPNAACGKEYADPETGAVLFTTSGLGYLNYGEPKPTPNATDISKKEIAGYKGVTYQDKQYCAAENDLCYQASFRVDGATTAGQYSITLLIGSKSIDQKDKYLQVFNQAVTSAKLIK